MSDRGDYDVNWMAERTGQVILAAVDGEGERAADLIIEIGERYGDHGIYGLCSALSEAVARLGDLKRDEDGFYGFEVHHLHRGVIAPEEADADAQDMVQAMRFVSAYLNNDTDQKFALFEAATSPDEAVLLPVGLVKLVGAYGRWKLEQNRGTDA